MNKPIKVNKKWLLFFGLFFILNLLLNVYIYSQNNYEKKKQSYLNGKPNLNGVWQILNTANFDLEDHSAKSAMALVRGPVVPIPDKRVVALGAVGSVRAGKTVIVGGKIPYQAWALKKKKENQEKWLERDPEIKCYLPGIPRATYMDHAFQIFQNENSVFFAYEYAGAVRDILFKDPGPAPTDTWMGQSVGHWDKNTFVVRTNGFNGETWLDRSGNFHSDQLEVIEKFNLESEHHLAYEATLTDPKVYTRPWTIKMILYKKFGENIKLQQFKCVEFVEELLYGHLRSKKESKFRPKNEDI